MTFLPSPTSSKTLGPRFGLEASEAGLCPAPPDLIRPGSAALRPRLITYSFPDLVLGLKKKKKYKIGLVKLCERGCSIT